MLNFYHDIVSFVMNASYVKSILGRLNIATTYVAKRNNDKFYPKLNREIKDMSDGEIKESIQNMIMYLQAPEYSFMMFRYGRPK